MICAQPAWQSREVLSIQTGWQSLAALILEHWDDGRTTP
jgi:hypothetical protein